MLHRWLNHRLAVPFLAVALLSGCATVRTTVPPENYRDLKWPTSYTVTTTDGEVRKASYVETQDSTLTIVRPVNPAYDRRPYPVTLRYADIQSVERESQVSLVYVELGAITGKNSGAASSVYSQWRGVLELGHMTGERREFLEPRWDGGATFYLAFSETDSRIGIKARARYRTSRHVSFDISAGPLFGWWDGSFINGFVGGGSVNLSPWFALRSEFMTYNAPAWREDIGETFVEHPGGYEQVWYNGAVFRGKPAWFTLGVGAAAFAALIILLVVNPPHIGY